MDSSFNAKFFNDKKKHQTSTATANKSLKFFGYLCLLTGLITCINQFNILKDKCVTFPHVIMDEKEELYTGDCYIYFIRNNTYFNNFKSTREITKIIGINYRPSNDLVNVIKEKQEESFDYSNPINFYGNRDFYALFKDRSNIPECINYVSETTEYVRIYNKIHLYFDFFFLSLQMLLLPIIFYSQWFVPFFMFIHTIILCFYFSNVSLLKIFREKFPTIIYADKSPYENNNNSYTSFLKCFIHSNFINQYIFLMIIVIYTLTFTWYILILIKNKFSKEKKFCCFDFSSIESEEDIESSAALKEEIAKEAIVEMNDITSTTV